MDNLDLDNIAPSFKEVLQNLEFVKFLLGQFFSNLGDAILRISLLLYVYSFTGSLSTTTLVLSAQVVPWIVIGPIAGVLADRISRKLIMVISDAIRASTIVVIPFTQDIGVLLVLSFIIGIASASFTAPRSAAIPEITGLRLFVKGISISQLIFQTVSVIGPLVGALIFASFGSVSFYVSSFGFILSAMIILLTWIPNADRDDAHLSILIIFSDLREGITFLFGNAVTRNLIILFTFIILSTAYASPLIYPYIFEILHKGNIMLEERAQTEYGIVGSIIAAGSILGNLVFGKYERKIGRGRAISIGGLMLGIYFGFFILHPTLIQIYVVGLIYGFFSGMMSLSVNAVFAEAVPNEIRGRAYSATNAYLQTFTALFTALSGITAEYFGIIQTIAGVGVLVFALVLIFSAITKYWFIREISIKITKFN